MLNQKIKEILFDLFNTYEECDEILDALCSLHNEGAITQEEYDMCYDQYEDVLAQWEAEGGEQ